MCKSLAPAVLIGLFLTISPLLAAAQNATSVWVGATANDQVGRQLAFAVKEGIRRSAGLQLADRPDDARISINLVTLDPDDRGVSTVYSAVYTVETFHETPVTMYLTQFVGVCGSSKVQSCAQGLVAITDEQSTKVRGWIRQILDQDTKKKSRS